MGILVFFLHHVISYDGPHCHAQRVRVMASANKFPSSLRYKNNIQPLDDAGKIMQAESKSFTWKRNGRSGIGFIAEDFDALGLTDLVIYNEDGQPDAIRYNLVPVYMLEVLKNQVQATEQLRQENELLKQRIEALERAIQGNQLLDFKGVDK